MCLWEAVNLEDSGKLLKINTKQHRYRFFFFLQAFGWMLVSESVNTLILFFLYFAELLLKWGVLKCKAETECLFVFRSWTRCSAVRAEPVTDFILICVEECFAVWFTALKNRFDSEVWNMEVGMGVQEEACQLFWFPLVLKRSLRQMSLCPKVWIHPEIWELNPSENEPGGWNITWKSVLNVCKAEKHRLFEMKKAQGRSWINTLDFVQSKREIDEVQKC